MKKQTLILIVIVIFSSFLLLTVSQKQPTTNTPNLNTNNQLNNIDKHFCQTEADCVLTSCDPDGFATCTNKKWDEIWEANPLSKNHTWKCELSGEEKCGCINNNCQRMDNSKSCGVEEFSPLPDRVSVKMAKGLFTQNDDIVAEIYNTLNKEIGFDDSWVLPFSTLSFEKLTDNENNPFVSYTKNDSLYCYAPTVFPPDYNLTRNWPVILKPNQSYNLIWHQKISEENIRACGGTNPMFEEGTYMMILNYCYPKTDECFNTYSTEFSVIVDHRD
ncbi:MAG: hypothetical protein WC575_04310 [Patescibacteria group bacterium]